MVQGYNRVCLMNENSKGEFVLNFVTLNAPIVSQGQINKRYLFPMKFGISYVYQKEWFQAYKKKKNNSLPP